MERPLDTPTGTQEFYRWIAKIAIELERAMNKRPYWSTDPIHAAAILSEEAGEVVKAANQFTYENHRNNEMEKEAIQTAAMAIRFLMNLSSYRPHITTIDHTLEARRGFGQETVDGPESIHN
jgi:NTP pyrophosphatase (non-canonical NTP hydrolase)